ncbi:hypothetical protein BDV37DRAFT_251148 [Aspergillus pseudonomiae]|uniref:Secreted protein n=1 Tax=Aspergillus pseudonomiae TaxID=1506151 RepID=A0A5N7D9E7_9EURO|nr:uncharacterized protein BDV37DRAFT_251148 [Aspergillus pseudonomiae]KAE8403092.1 hypothetical protein BDV37DRAFT_251148 [Aspergillus pseudonomiae]
MLLFLVFLFYFLLLSSFLASPLHLQAANQVPNLLPQFLPGVYQNRQLSKLPDSLIYLDFWCNTLEISAVRNSIYHNIKSSSHRAQVLLFPTALAIW